MTEEYEVVDESEETMMTHTDSIRHTNGYQDEVLQEKFPKFRKWFDGLARFGGNLIDATIIEILDWEEKAIEISGSFKEPVGVRVTFFTERHQYVIRFSKHASYLGAAVNKRTPRAGENWTRGCDLSDGPYCEETWREILNDIVAYEMVRLGK